jgi:hypothetical protein
MTYRYTAEEVQHLENLQLDVHMYWIDPSQIDPAYWRQCAEWPEIHNDDACRADFIELADALECGMLSRGESL